MIWVVMLYFGNNNRSNNYYNTSFNTSEATISGIENLLAKYKINSRDQLEWGTTKID